MILIKRRYVRLFTQFSDQRKYFGRILRILIAARAFDRVLSPIYPEQQARRKWLKNGISITKDVGDSLVNVAIGLSVITQLTGLSLIHI